MIASLVKRHDRQPASEALSVYQRNQIVKLNQEKNSVVSRMERMESERRGRGKQNEGLASARGMVSGDQQKTSNSMKVRPAPWNISDRGQNTTPADNTSPP